MTLRRKIFSLFWIFAALFAANVSLYAEENSTKEHATAEQNDSVRETRPVHKQVFVIPVHGEINQSNWYIFRRGVKEALAKNADVLVLDINTPGGALDITLQMIDALQRFPGKTITFINPDAISAGAYISSATQEIYFSPNGRIGAAAVVTGSGEDIDTTMKQKIDAYLKSVVRTISKDHPYRADVIRAMMDESYELKIDGELLLDKNGDPVKTKGELLALTSTEAMQLVGKDQRPLLGSGIYNDVDSLLDGALGKGQYTVEKMKPSGIESFAQAMEPFAPILLGLGIMLIFFELKSPGFGVPGILGICLIAVYFAIQHVAGLSGYEGIILFVLGLVLIAVEIFFLPGMIIFGLLGVVLLLAGILWSSADIWKMPDGSFDFDWSLFFEPLRVLGLAMGTIMFVGVLAYKLLPQSWIKNRIVLATTTGDVDLDVAKGALSRGSKLPSVGAVGVAMTEFRPSGVVMIDGKRYEASSETTAIERGDQLEVVGYGDFMLIVRKKA